MPEDSPIPSRTRLILVAWAFGVALVLAGGSIDPRGIILIPFFPTGLPAFFIASPASGGTVSSAAMGWAVKAAYVIYIGLVGLTLRVSRRRTFYILFTILLLLLVLNVIGCHQDRQGTAGSFWRH